jgi:ABC-2 type transport system permease protein
MMIGSFALVLLITLLTSMSALTLGIMISTGANNEFQMIQFIPVVIIPQVFFCGLFDLSPGLAFIGRVMPVYYVADALKEIMLKGSGFSAIAGDAAVLLGFSIVFMIINTQLLKKYRRI